MSETYSPLFQDTGLSLMFQSTQTIQTPEEGLIQFQNVHKIYQSSAGKFAALKGINLTIERGEFAAIVGKSGSGKTTL